MRRARISSPDGPRECIEQDGRWHEVTDYLGAAALRTGWSTPDDGTAVLLTPVVPPVIVGLGTNTRPYSPDAAPRMWLKSPRTVTDPGAPIPVRAEHGRIVAEGELAVVIGRPVHRIGSDEEARAAILGWTIANDVTASDLITAPNYLTRAKGGLAFTPLGPWIADIGDDADLAIEVDVNGEERCRSTTAELILRSVVLVREISDVTPLGAGDVILTGAPHTGTTVIAGDVVEIRIPGLGALSNPIIAG